VMGVMGVMGVMERAWSEREERTCQR